MTMIQFKGALTHFANPLSHRDNAYSNDQKSVISVAKSREAIKSITSWPSYAPTNLHRLDDLTKDCGFGEIWYKDEATRFGLKSFKALGGAYAVARQLQDIIEAKTGAEPTITDILNGTYKDAISEIVVTCATDGNHGRSVAWGAQMFGCRCVIYIHRDVSEGRKQAMEAFGAEVIRIAGNYDESVRLADSEAKAKGRIIVSDTSYEGYMDVPKDVALGYTVMLSETVDQLGGDIPTHVFIQGGVGGLASAVTGYFWDLWGEKRPRIVVVEPEQANCLQKSAQAGHPVTVEGDLDTLMAGLACGEVSLLGWQILSNGADDFVTMSENMVAPVMQFLARGYKSDAKIEAGESAVAGLGAAILASQDREMTAKLGLNDQSRILVIGTEGATDPEMYERLVGQIWQN